MQDDLCAVERTVRTFVSIGVETSHPLTVDKKTGPDSDVKCCLWSTLKSDMDFRSWFGIPRSFFNVLLELVPMQPVKAVSKADKLLIVLMKLRVNLSYIQMAPMFSVERQTLSKYFKEGV